MTTNIFNGDKGRHLNNDKEIHLNGDKKIYFNSDIRRHLMVTREDRRHRVDRSYNALGAPLALQIFFWKRKYNQTNVAFMYTSFEWENTPCLADCLFLLEGKIQSNTTFHLPAIHIFFWEEKYNHTLALQIASFFC